MFDLQPTLTGDLVTIRPIHPDDWLPLFEAGSDPEIWALHPASNRYEEAEFREFFDGAIESGSAFVFEDNRTQRIIGSSRYHGYDESLGEIEIGWTFLAREYWGGNYNREVKHLMLTHAFKYVSTVIFWVGDNNLRSQRAMEKIGGVRREGVTERILGGETHLHVVFEITKSGYGFTEH